MHIGKIQLAWPKPLVEANAVPPAETIETTDESIRGHLRAGWIVIGLFFGVLGTWSMLAPLNGAVLADAVVKVEGNRKSLEHLDGGIVKEFKVKENDRVEAGQLLLLLDDNQAKSQYDVLAKQQTVLRATEARLSAEIAQSPTLQPPDEIQTHLAEPEVKAIWETQLRQFRSRATTRQGARKVIEQKIGQLREQIAGSEKQAKSFQEQLGSVQSELASISPLVEQGLIAQTRKSQLERTQFGLQGQIGQVNAEAAGARQAIAEQTQQIAQLGNERTTDVAKELHETQASLIEIGPRILNASAVLSRTAVRAPYAGTVVGLTVFSTGQVIPPGGKILDIVPDNSPLTVEASVQVEDVSDIRPGMAADVQLTSYKQRITPSVRGVISEISADRLTDTRTGMPYYTAQIDIDPKSLAEMKNVHLYPGMPAKVLIPTVERTAFDYLMGPLAQSFTYAFRER